MKRSCTNTADDIEAKLRYEPETGRFFWLKSASRRIHPGDEAGFVQATGTKAGKQTAYKLITVDGKRMSACRIAWRLYYGDWPKYQLRYKDGDTLNVCIANLCMTNGIDQKFDRNDPEQRKAYQRAHRETHPHIQRGNALQATFGIDLAEYAAMAAAQNNCCDICAKPETATRGGKLRALCVDHDHSTGAVRSLLCSACNQGLGQFKDNRDTLLAAVKYLDKHAGIEQKRPALTVMKRETT